MATVLRVTIEIDSIVMTEDEDYLDLVRHLAAGLSPETLDADLLLWLVEGAATRVQVTI